MPGQAWKKQRHELWEQFRDHGTTTALAELFHRAAYLAPQPGLDAVINEFFKLAGNSEHYDAGLIQDDSPQRSIETTFSVSDVYAARSLTTLTQQSSEQICSHTQPLNSMK